MTQAKVLKVFSLLKDKIDWVINERALKYGSGIHPKHSLIKYHDFFSLVELKMVVKF